jgi:hypothetical protein
MSELVLERKSNCSASDVSTKDSSGHPLKGRQGVVSLPFSVSTYPFFNLSLKIGRMPFSSGLKLSVNI